MIRSIPRCRFSRRARVRSAGDRQAGRVVDIERQRLEIGGGAREIAEIVLADLAHAQVLAADPRLLGEDTRGELVGRHFEAEEGDARAERLARRDPVLACRARGARGVERDVGGERGLAHAGAPRQDDQIGAVHAAHLGVDAVEPGGDARDMPARIERALGILDRLGRRLEEALDRALFAALLRHPVERDLGLLDLRLGIDLVGGVHRALDHPAPDADQRAQQREIVDLRGEVARADQRRARAGELRQIGGAAELLHRLVGLEQRAQRHRVGDHVLVDDAQDLRVDRGRGAARRNAPRAA